MYAFLVVVEYVKKDDNFEQVEYDVNRFNNSWEKIVGRWLAETRIELSTVSGMRWIIRALG